MMAASTLVDDRSRIASALLYISPDDRDLWVKMGMAVKSELADDDGFSIWDDWSQGAGRYEAASARTTWRSIEPGGKVRIGTLYREAKANGWTDNGIVVRQTHEQIAKRNADRAVSDAQAAEAEAVKHAKAATKAVALWAKARPAEADHPYLVRKRVAPVDTLREIDLADATAILGYVPKSKVDALTGRLLVAPVVCGQSITTCELIDVAGLKTVVFDGKKAGGYWAAQRMPEGDGAGLTVVIGEGVATGLSIKQATDHYCIAALSNNNLLKVSEAMRQRYPAAVIVLAADLDKRTGAPDHDAVEAAAAVGGLLAVPEFGQDRPEGETDFNDLAVRFGPDAVSTCINGAAQVATDVTASPATDTGWPEPCQQRM